MSPECTPSYLKEFQLHQQLAHPKMGLRMPLCDISCLNLEDFHMINYCDQIQQLPVIELYPFMSKGNMLCYDDNTMGILVLCSSGPASGSPIMILKLQCHGMTSFLSFLIFVCPPPHLRHLLTPSALVCLPSAASAPTLRCTHATMLRLRSD